MATSLPTPWVEKYRPKTVSEVSSQDEACRLLHEGVKSGNIPHLLFYGPPGTGKTSTILALARELFGPQLYKKRVLELNASDERGISVIREKVKTFAAGAVAKRALGPGGKPAPTFKLIVLDEADSMTADAQAALRRTMELYTNVTRFCLICNYVSRIIEPLASRCAKFRFVPLPREPMLKRLEHVAKEENVKCTPDAFEALLSASQGDMRRAINLFQSSARFNSSSSVDALVVNEVAGVVPKFVSDKLWQSIESGPFDGVNETVQEVLADGFSASMMLRQIQDQVLSSSNGLDDVARAEMLLRLARVDKNLVEGANEELQLLETCTGFSGLVQKTKRAKLA